LHPVKKCVSVWHKATEPTIGIMAGDLIFPLEVKQLALKVEQHSRLEDDC